MTRYGLECSENWSEYCTQCRLLRLAIGNFPGQKVTCPVISGVDLTECPVPIPIRLARVTYVRMHARSSSRVYIVCVMHVATTPILPRGRRIFEIHDETWL